MRIGPNPHSVLNPFMLLRICAEGSEGPGYACVPGHRSTRPRRPGTQAIDRCRAPPCARVSRSAVGYEDHGLMIPKKEGNPAGSPLQHLIRGRQTDRNKPVGSVNWSAAPRRSAGTRQPLPLQPQQTLPSQCNPPTGPSPADLPGCLPVATPTVVSRPRDDARKPKPRIASFLTEEGVVRIRIS